MRITMWIAGVAIVGATFGLAQPPLEITGILGGEKPIAIVNGKMLQVGEEIDGVEVLEIGQYEVKFRYEGQVFAREVGKKEDKEESHDGYRGALKEKLDTEEPTVDLLRSVLASFPYERGERCTFDESRRMLEFLEASNVGSHDGGRSVAGILKSGYEVTIWPHSYDKPYCHGIRFGRTYSGGRYYGSTKAYFEICKDELPEPEAVPVARVEPTEQPEPRPTRRAPAAKPAPAVRSTAPRAAAQPQPEGDAGQQFSGFIQYSAKFAFGKDLKAGDYVKYSMMGEEDNPFYDSSMEVYRKQGHEVWVKEVIERNEVHYVVDLSRMKLVRAFGVAGGAETDIPLADEKNIQQLYDQFNEMTGGGAMGRGTRFERAKELKDITVPAGTFRCSLVEPYMPPEQTQGMMPEHVEMWKGVSRICFSEKVPRLLPFMKILAGIQQMASFDALQMGNGGIVKFGSFELAEYRKGK